MAQTRLLNRSGRIIKAGDPVKLHPKYKDSFLYAELGSIIIGTAPQLISTGTWGVINLINTVSWSDIINKPTTVSGYGITDAAEQSNGSSSNSYMPSGW